MASWCLFSLSNTSSLWNKKTIHWYIYLANIRATQQIPLQRRLQCNKHEFMQYTGMYFANIRANTSVKRLHLRGNFNERDMSYASIMYLILAKVSNQMHLIIEALDRKRCIIRLPVIRTVQWNLYHILLMIILLFKKAEMKNMLPYNKSIQTSIHVRRVMTCTDLFPRTNSCDLYDDIEW